MKTTAVIPFWNGASLDNLIGDLGDMPVVIAVDCGSAQPEFTAQENVRVVQVPMRGYFAGAVNYGVEACPSNDVLILNQDIRLIGGEWRGLVDGGLDAWGDGVFNHPAWPQGYIQGTFMWVTRKAWEHVGKFNELDYPLWGCTAEWQVRAVRKGLKVKPIDGVPGLQHAHRTKYQVGSAIAEAALAEPDKRELFFQTPPAISVIVPCYNYGRYLDEAINSLMEQTFQSFEVVIVDDASTDDSWEICKRLHNPMVGIRSIRHERNRGTAAAINTGIKASYGRLVTVLSADDWYKPTRLETLYRASLAYPNSVIYDDIVWRTENGDTIKQMNEYHFDDLMEGKIPGLLNRNVMHAGIMFPRKAWQVVGGYPEIMNDGREDWAFNIALGRSGYCGVHVNEALYIYRRQKQNRSLTNTDPLSHAKFLAKLRGLFPDVFSGRYPVGCCGGRKTGRTKAPIKRSASMTKAAVVRPDGYVELRYVGKNVGTQTWYGAKTGQVYKFGLSARRQNGFVHPDDVGALLNTKEFIKVMAPTVQAVVEQIAPPIQTQLGEVALVESMQDVDEFDIEPDDSGLDITTGAAKYARELGVDVRDIEVVGRVTKRDVEEYARRTGLL